MRRLLTRAIQSARRLPTLEIHVPISPTPLFLNMLQCLAVSLRRFGGAYRDAPIIASVGADSIDTQLAERNPWLSRCGIELRWVPEEAFRAHSYFATGMERFVHDYRSDVVLFLDADVLVARPFDRMIRDVHRCQHFAGVIAQTSPLQGDHTWQHYYDSVGVGRPAVLAYEHPGFPYIRAGEAYRRCPPYFNYGVVCAPATVMKRIGPAYAADVITLREVLKDDLAAQVAVTTTLVKLGIPWQTLPLRYNLPNHPMLEALHSSEMAQAIFLHFKENHQVFKNDAFASIGQIRAMIHRDDLRGVNEIIRKVLLPIEPDLDIRDDVDSGHGIRP